MVGRLTTWPGRLRPARNQLATAALVVVLGAVSGFALWSANSVSRSSRAAVISSRLANDYASAARAVAAEESLERKYRLEPGPDVRARYDAAADDLLAALAQARRDADTDDADSDDGREAARVVALHGPYLTSIAQMYAAVDRGDTAEVLRIDAEEVDPQFAAIEEAVDVEAADHHDAALQALSDLNGLTDFNARATPLVFLTGLTLVTLFSSVLRRTQRQLDLQRHRAVHDALHDRLTGLANRTLLADRCEQALRTGRRDSTVTGLLLIDLDRFREVNDTLGHLCGDALLRQIGPRLASALREVDSIARLGGDEFAVLLPDVDGVEGSTAAAARVREALTEPFTVDGIDLHVEASVGVVVSGLHGDDAPGLLQRADVAMYVAKAQSLGVFVYTTEVDGHSPERLALLGELRRGMDRGELVLHYQPKVSLSSRTVCGVEALVRWQHPERGLIPPDQFIPLAEHTGLIDPLTRHILSTALAQVRAWSDDGLVMPVAVNLSARNLLDEHLADVVTELLLEHGVPTRLLELEVTESAIMIEPLRAQRLLTRLHDLGVKVAVDDFGAGYTSLAQLRHLPITELKIDKSFVLDMDVDSGNALIVQSVVDLGHNLGLTTIAEGVESPEAADMLRGLGCDVAQGYHFGRPMPPDRFLDWHREFTEASLPADLAGP